MKNTDILVADISGWLKDWLDRFEKNRIKLAPIQKEHDELFEELHQAFGSDEKFSLPPEVQNAFSEISKYIEKLKTKNEN